MKSDKRCGTCEWLRSGFCRAMNGSECLYSNNGTVPDYVCRFWSANLDGAACEKCVYWIPSSYEKTRHLCKRHAPKTVGDHVAGWGSDWMYTDHLDLCGEFVPGVV
jgi:hypothetical protein